MTQVPDSELRYDKLDVRYEPAVLAGALNEWL